MEVAKDVSELSVRIFSIIPRTLAVSPGAFMGIFRFSEKSVRIPEPTEGPNEELEVNEINDDKKNQPQNRSFKK